VGCMGKTKVEDEREGRRRKKAGSPQQKILAICDETDPWDIKGKRNPGGRESLGEKEPSPKGDRFQ